MAPLPRRCEMDWLLLLLAMVGLALIVGAGAALLGRSIPAPENRPMPPERMADLEEARDAALRTIAARVRQREQREASARISRGF